MKFNLICNVLKPFSSLIFNILTYEQMSMFVYGFSILIFNGKMSNKNLGLFWHLLMQIFLKVFRNFQEKWIDLLLGKIDFENQNKYQSKTF